MNKQQADATLLPKQQPAEPSRWYARFCDFCFAGPSRTLEGVWRIAAKGSKGQRTPGSWQRACDQWNWRARAAEFDSGCHKREAIALDTMRREERTRRRLVVSKLGMRVETMLADKNSPAVAVAALARVYLAASCAEFGNVSADLPQSEPVTSEEWRRISALMMSGGA